MRSIVETSRRLASRAPSSYLRISVLTVLAALIACDATHGESDDAPPVRMIGATAAVTEVSTGLPLLARVDTGATSCSIHCEAIEIEDALPEPKDNIGKAVRFLVRNKRGQAEWLEAVIVDHVTVRTSMRADQRYKVQLALRWEDVEKSVHVTLNDRRHMKYPVLIGRNFLRDDFVVNVAWEHRE